MTDADGSYSFEFNDKNQNEIATLYRIGWENRTLSDYYLDGNFLEDSGTYIFQYTISGSGTLEIDDKTFILTPGQAFMVNVSGNYRYYLSKSSKNWEFIYITLQGKEVEKCWNYVKQTFGSVLKIPADSFLIQLLFSIYQDTADKKITDPFISSLSAYNFIMECYRYFKSEANVKEDVMQNIEKAILFIQSNYHKPITLDEMTNIANLSKYYFIKKFKEHTDMSPIQYLTKVRIERAFALLRDMNLTINHISEQVGYDNPNYFNKVFRRVVGISPGQFRKTKYSLMLKDFIIDNSIKNKLYKDVFLLILQHGSITKNDLLQQTKIKKTTLNRIVDELLKSKYIMPGGHRESSSGRPPVLYKVNPEAAYIIGIDISRTETKIVLVNLSFQVLERISISMTDKHVPSITFAEIKKIIRSWLNIYQIPFEDLLGIGVGTVGPVQRSKGVIVNPEAFLAPNWGNVPVKDILKETFPVKIIVDNGANSAAAGEYFRLNSTFHNILCVIGGYGIRCGVISNKQLVYSSTGDASAFGHIIVQAGDKLCSCGKKGCLSSYSTFGAILSELKEKLPEYQNLSISDIIDELENDNKVVKEVLSHSAYYYGIGIANMINILHPEVVILYGRMIFESSWYFEEVVEQTRKNMYMQDESTVKFIKGSLGADAIAIGAATQVFQSFF